MTRSLIALIFPSREADGRQAYSARGQLFDGVVEGRKIVSRSPQPLLDGARALLAEGAAPAVKLVMRHAGQDYYALRSSVGVAAKLRTKDDPSGKPMFDSHQVWSETFLAKPPMRQTEVAATRIAPLAEAA